MKNQGRPKGRTSVTYQKKVDKIKKWHAHLAKERAKENVINKNTKEEPKRKELKPLEYYIEQLKKPNITR